MKVIRWYGTLIALTIIVSSFAANHNSVVEAGTSIRSQGAVTRVSPVEARQAASWQVITEVRTEEKGGRWGGKQLKVGRPIEVYDTDGTHIAYLVNVFTDGMPAGYLMVSAFVDETPILLWADGGQAFAAQRVKGKLGSKASQIAKQQVVWLGGVRFAARFTLTDGEVMHITEDGVEGPGTLNPWYKIPFEQNPNARRFWGLAKKMKLGKAGVTNPIDDVTDINPATWETGFSFVERAYISGMDGINQKQFDYDPGSMVQWSGCSPTAGSNIMTYWANNGYPALNPTRNQRDIVMALRTTMGTTQQPLSANETEGITSPFATDNGLQEYARSKGLSTAASTHWWWASWEYMKPEIQNNRPALWNMSGQPYFGSHTVTLVGYKGYGNGTYTDPNHRYLVVRNNWELDENGNGNWVYTHNLYLKWNTWSIHSMTSFAPSA